MAALAISLNDRPDIPEIADGGRRLRTESGDAPYSLHPEHNCLHGSQLASHCTSVRTRGISATNRRAGYHPVIMALPAATADETSSCWTCIPPAPSGDQAEPGGRLRNSG